MRANFTRNFLLLSVTARCSNLAAAPDTTSVNPAPLPVLMSHGHVGTNVHTEDMSLTTNAAAGSLEA